MCSSDLWAFSFFHLQQVGATFVAVHGLLIAVASRCRARALGAWASVVVACGLSSCGTQAWLLCGTWDLPGPGLEPMSPALAGGFLTTAPPGKSWSCILLGSGKKQRSAVEVKVCLTNNFEVQITSFKTP